MPPDHLRAFERDRPVAEGCPLGAARDNADVLGHGILFLCRQFLDLLQHGVDLAHDASHHDAATLALDRLGGELGLMGLSVLVALGALAFDACLRVLSQRGEQIPSPRPRFAHGGRYVIGRQVVDS